MQQKKNIISITTSAANSCAAHTTTFMKHISMLALLLMTFALGARGQLADGVYTINNATGNRGTMCYGTYGDTDYFGMAEITLSGHESKSVTVNDVKNKYWYVATKDGVTYLYNIGQGTFLQKYTDVAASCATTCNGGFTLEASESHYRVKDNSYYLSFCCYTLPEAQMRWLTSNEEAATLIDFRLVENGDITYATDIVAARAKIGYADSYYIKCYTAQNLYLKPVSNITGSFLTVSIAKSDDNLWQIEHVDGAGYRIKHASTGYYIYRNGSFGTNKSVQLSTTNNNANQSYFYLETNVNYSNAFAIEPTADDRYSFNIWGGRTEGNTIGLYTHPDNGNSMWIIEKRKVPTPEIIQGDEGYITIRNSLSGTSFYYTVNGGTPTCASTLYDDSNKPKLNHGDQIRVVGVADGYDNSDVASVVVNMVTPIPTITINAEGLVTITSSMAGCKIYYTTDGTEPTESSNEYTSQFKVASGSLVKAIAIKSGYMTSLIASGYYVVAGGVLSGSGTEADPYEIGSMDEWITFAQTANNASGQTYHVRLTADISGYNITVNNFTGTLDGQYHTLSGLNAPLIATVSNATVKNVVLKDVNVIGTGNVGALVGTASGTTRIYNCGVLSGTVGGGDNVGSIAGEIQGSARVINCYSFADITGGTTVGGIVGYNAFASNSNDLQTLVMNCMYYGNINRGINIAPIYNGQNITNNTSTGINNYNYYRYQSPYSLDGSINIYNCALAAEERYLTRHEFYRGILNSNKELCCWYITGQTNQSDLIGKWVLDPDIAKYPIIKPQGRYKSLVNRFITTEDVNTLSTETHKVKLLSDEGDNGYLKVTMNNGKGNGNTKELTLILPITDMNYDTFDYNYAKVVLPFYNQYFDDNYKDNKVVTGWEITSIDLGTKGSLETTGTNAYNYADRSSTAKDLERIFAQGGYYNVPDGVKAITITAKWADAVYLSDAYYDRTGYDLNDLRVTGQRFQNGGKYMINGSSQTVYTSLSNAIANLNKGQTVYDKAIVLVGNYHSNDNTWSSDDAKPFTIMSADLDYDNEPDFCIFHYHNERKNINPIRFDFLWHPGIGMAHKKDGATNMRNQGIFHPTGWFEITETALARYTEFEYAYGGGTTPVILNNGIFEQFVTRHDDNRGEKSYIILGGNLYMKQFSPGTHVDNKGQTKHCPVNVLGGEYETFYLSGMFRTDVVPYDDKNVMCYTNGGKFGLMAGAGHEKVNANVLFKINNSIINEFYGGGINANNPITGYINVQIDNSYVTKYCGGPMFGSMTTQKTVTTNANGTVFGKYYGAGNGGTSLNRQKTNGGDGTLNYSWRTWMNDYSSLTYNKDYGIQVQPEYEYFAYAGGGSERNVGRFYVNYAKFDKAQTNDVSSTLNNCTILSDFYGGGNLGYVNGNATSVLNNCIVEGSAYGGGFSAQIPTVLVYPNGFITEPSYNGAVGVYNLGVFGEPTKYTWSNKDGLSSSKTYDTSDYTIWSDIELVNLGEIAGNTSITINGNSLIKGGVYGGGNASKVSGQTNVIIETADNSDILNVYGGANQADVDGATTVNIKSGKITNVFGANNIKGTKKESVIININQTDEKKTIIENVYGGGNLANYEGNPYIYVNSGNIHENVFGGGLSADVKGNPVVNILGGTIGFEEKDEDGNIINTTGQVFGGGSQGNIQGNTTVNITGGTILKNVYGGGYRGNVTGKTNVTIGQQPVVTP